MLNKKIRETHQHNQYLFFIFDVFSLKINKKYRMVQKLNIEKNTPYPPLPPNQ